MPMTQKQRINKLVKNLRRNQTESEKILWEHLRNRKLDGVKFYRQRPLIYSFYKRFYFFVADFYSAEKSLVIELDGKIHDYQADYDYQRDLIIREFGLKLLRIKNEELSDIEQVKNKIRQYF
jgi:very-short-patch-repair endonuclease